MVSYDFSNQYPCPTKTCMNLCTFHFTSMETWNWYKYQKRAVNTIALIILIIHIPKYKIKHLFLFQFQLPQLATSSSYLSKVVGVTNPIHRSKITLKAMDVVLFGPPKEIFSTWWVCSIAVFHRINLFNLFFWLKNKVIQWSLAKQLSNLSVT